MSRDDIIRMAREAGWAQKDIDSLLCIVETAAAAEREACAKVCEEEGKRVDASWASCAYAIRARGE